VQEPTITKGKKGAALQVRSSTKSLLIVFFFDVKEIVDSEFVPPNTTINSDFCCDVLRRLRENVRRKDRNFGAATTGSFITTTHPPTHP
jgi:hypothetical protein